MAVFELRGKRVWVAGHSGLVGSALCRRLASESCELLTISHGDLDLRDQRAVDNWYQTWRPQVVIMAAATVGGIEANRTQPADFLYDNLSMATHVIQGAARHGVEKLLFLGSSCCYPREATQPIQESSLLTGPLEPTNEGYAVAKIAGMKLVQSFRRQYGHDFIAAIPTNLYGPGDHFDGRAHVLGALLRRFDEAVRHRVSEVTVWGTGTPLREFLYVDDAADGLVFLLKHYSEGDPINVAGGQTLSIRDLAERIAALTGFEGILSFDTDKPDGMPRKSLDPSRLQQLGWQAQTSMEEGLQRTWAHYQARLAEGGV